MLTITQKSYADSILERLGTQHSDAVSTPQYEPELPGGDNLQMRYLASRERSYSFQSTEERLLYLAQCTQFDLCYPVPQLMRGCNKLAEAHMTVAKNVLRYLSDPPDLPIMHKRGYFGIEDNTDASFGVNPINRKSTTGYRFFLGTALIDFGAETQSLTAQSTVESELQAPNYAAGKP